MALKLVFRLWLYCCFAFPLVSVGQTLDLRLDDLEHPAFSARGVVLHLTQGGAAALDVASLTMGSQQLVNLRVRCEKFSMTPTLVDCQRGRVGVSADKTAEKPWLLDWRYETGGKRLSVEIHEADFSGLARLLPVLAQWHPAGHFSARGRLDPGQIRLQLDLREASFADAAGLHAGDKINARLNLKAVAESRPGQPGKSWHWQAAMDWPRGELYIAPLYRSGAMGITASGNVNETALIVGQAELNLADIGKIRGAGQWQRDGAAGTVRLQSAEASSEWLDLSASWPALLQPFIDAMAGPKITASGRARVAVSLDSRGMRSFDAALENVSLMSGHHALRGVRANIPWRRDARTTVEFNAEGGQLGALPVGAFSVPLVLQGESVDFARSDIPVLDGRLILEDFHADKLGGQWQWRLGAALEPIAMPRLTEALGWPGMAGVFSATIPRIRYADATLSLEGQWMVSVFDGYLAIDGLKVIEPLGELPRLQGNIEARHLDLGMLTQTYAFGDITGYLDADIRGLEMSGMRPLAFDAHLRSSPGEYRKRISQRAVQNISSLGGAGAAAAIQRSFLNVFETFGYDRIGVHCRLENGVCQMGGIEAPSSRFDDLAGKLGVSLPGTLASLPASGYVLVQGGGLPSLNVIGYNRRVDWEGLVERLKAALASNGSVQVR